jgi:Transposase, Mutator family
MLRVVEKPTKENEELRSTLDEILQRGALKMLQEALEAEVDEYIKRHREARDERGRAQVVRNGKAPARQLVTGSGTLDVRAPRVNDRRVDGDGARQRFSSQILPRCLRRAQGDGGAAHSLSARVGCENLVTPPGRTRARHHRGDHGAQWKRCRMPTPMPPPWSLARVARGTALDVAGARCSDRRTLQGSAQGAAGSKSAASQDIPSGRCARTARQPRWLEARETASERSQSPHCGTPRRSGW